MSTMPEIYYYVVRQGVNDERFVPMIPIDQLPDWLEVVGVPRALNTEEAAKMTALLDIGRKGGAAGIFDVRVDEVSTCAASTSTASTSPTSPVSSAVSLETQETHTSTAQATDNGKADEEAPRKEANTDSKDDADCEPAATTKPETAPVAKLPDSSPAEHTHTQKPEKPETTGKTEKTLPCKYWCKFGRCGFKNSCRFVHIMPMTKEGLSLVGLDKLPQWFVKDAGLGGTNGTKRSNPTSRNSSNSREYHNGHPAARKKTYKIQKTTTMVSSPYTFNKDGGTRGPEPEPRETGGPTAAAMEATPAREVEGDLIDLV